MTTTHADIDDFLAHQRLALVGISRNPKDFSRTVFRDLRARHYDMVPVNPFTSEVEGQRCFARLQDVDPPVEGALLMTSPKETERVVRDCVEAGIPRVWMHSGGGQGSVSSEAVEFCQKNSIRLVAGHCPYMFLPRTPFFHRLHGFILKFTGRYPKNAPSPPTASCATG